MSKRALLTLMVAIFCSSQAYALGVDTGLVWRWRGLFGSGPGTEWTLRFDHTDVESLRNTPPDPQTAVVAIASPVPCAQMPLACPFVIGALRAATAEILAKDTGNGSTLVLTNWHSALPEIQWRVDSR